jgi:hypothetical protein
VLGQDLGRRHWHQGTAGGHCQQVAWLHPSCDPEPQGRRAARRAPLPPCALQWAVSLTASSLTVTHSDTDTNIPPGRPLCATFRKRTYSRPAQNQAGSDAAALFSVSRWTASERGRRIGEPAPSPKFFSEREVSERGPMSVGGPRSTPARCSVRATQAARVLPLNPPWQGERAPASNQCLVVRIPGTGASIRLRSTSIEVDRSCPGTRSAGRNAHPPAMPSRPSRGSRRSGSKVRSCAVVGASRTELTERLLFRWRRLGGAIAGRYHRAVQRWHAQVSEITASSAVNTKEHAQP